MVGAKRWSWGRLAAVAAGGVVGAATRWAVLTAASPHGSFPWLLLLINACGSLVLGAVMAAEPDHPRARVWLHDAGGIGFCGGLTTFSTFAVEIVDLIDHHRAALAIGYGAASVTAALAAAVIGAVAFRHLLALEAPLEGAP